VPRQPRLGGLRPGEKRFRAPPLPLGEFGLCPGLLQLGLERLDLLGGEHAGVVAILVILLIGGGKQGRKLGQPQALLLVLGQQFRELALQNVGIMDQLCPPAAGGDRLEVGLQVFHIAGEGAADLVFGQQPLTPGPSPGRALSRKMSHF